MRIFISHSSENAELAKELCGKLEKNGFPCFLAPRDIRSGFEYAEEIINGIDSSDVMVLLLSEASNSSPHVLREVERAVSKKKTIIVYKLEEVQLSKSLEYFLMTHQWVNDKPGRDFDEIVKRVAEYAEQVGEPHKIVVEQKPEKTANSRKYVILIAAIFVVILVVWWIVAAVFFSKNNEGNSESSEQSVVESTESSSVSTSSSSTVSSSSTSSVESSQSSSSTQSSVEVIIPVDSESKPEKQPLAVKLGDRITLGSYNGEAIEWRVIKISEDKTKAVVISDKILTMKAFDAAECGTFNKLDGEDYWRTKSTDLTAEIQRQIRGDNRWELSNIRTWLNSARENVTYTGQAPTTQAMSEHKNGYQTEAGFLNGFSEKERAAIVETQINTAGSVTSDKVFLLSQDELKWLYQADVSVYAKPTAAAVEQDKSNWYKVDCENYNVEDFFWWLRDADSETACECLCANISYFEDKPTVSYYAGLEGFGVRPAMTIDLTSDILEN
ncbi:MAG: TIR domain-containing protein [Oscillospiraceae bacterium]